MFFKIPANYAQILLFNLAKSETMCGKKRRKIHTTKLAFFCANEHKGIYKNA